MHWESNGSATLTLRTSDGAYVVLCDPMEVAKWLLLFKNIPQELVLTYAGLPLNAYRVFPNLNWIPLP